MTTEVTGRPGRSPRLGIIAILVAVVPVIAIVFRAGRQLGYATSILRVPQAAFVLYGPHPLFTIPQNGLL